MFSFARILNQRRLSVEAFDSSEYGKANVSDDAGSAVFEK